MTPNEVRQLHAGEEIDRSCGIPKPVLDKELGPTMLKAGGPKGTRLTNLEDDDVA